MVCPEPAAAQATICPFFVAAAGLERQVPSAEMIFDHRPPANEDIPAAPFQHSTLELSGLQAIVV